MENCHKIESAIFDISFGSEAELREQQNGLGALTKNRLMNAVEEIFEEMSIREDNVLCIDRLEIDLGTVEYPNFEQTLLYRLDERLRASLAEKLATAANGGSDNERLLERHHYDLEQLEHFLSTGQAPWNKDTSGDLGIDSWLKQQIRSNGAGLVSWLQTRIQSQYAMQRLVKQISADILADLTRLQAPHAPWLADIPVHLLKIKQLNELVKTSEQRLDHFIWEHLMTSLLKKESTNLGEKALIEGLFRSISRHYGVSYSELLRLIRTGVEQQPPLNQVPVGGEFAAIVRKIGQASELPTGNVELEHQTETRLVLQGDTGDPRAQVQNLLQSESMIRGYDLYEQLLTELFQPSATELHAEKILDDLKSRFPEVLLRFCLELQNGQLPWRQVAAKLSVDSLRSIIEIFVRLKADADGRWPSDFLAAISVSAEKSRDEKRRLERVFECLVTDTLIDLERIAKETGTPSDTDSRPADLIVADPDQQQYQKDDRDSPASEISAKNALVEYFSEADGSSESVTDRLIDSLERMLTGESAWLQAFLDRTLSTEAGAAKLIDLLPERLLSGALLLLRPEAHARAQQFADILANACCCQAINPKIERIHTLKWEFIFQYFFQTRRSFHPETFIHEFVGFMAARLSSRDRKGLVGAITRQLTLNRLSVPKARYIEIRQFLSGSGDQAKAIESGASERSPLESPKTAGEQDGARSESIYIANAGQVIAAPYLPRLFSSLELMRKSIFFSREAQERAVHLLQFMVNGSTDSPEYQLTLNKILCGLASDTPIDRSVAMTEKEQTTVEGLIAGMIANWKSLGNTSVVGFRESFLQRDGRLFLKDDAWRLEVEQRAFDMLLDHLPWSFSLIKHPWMKRALYVEWR